MKVYLLTRGDIGANQQDISCFFFKRSAMRAAERLRAEGGNWKAVNDHGTDAIEWWTTSARLMAIVPVYLLFRSWSLREWIKRRCHWQNLNEDRDGKIKGSILRYGRLWLHRAWDEKNPESYRRAQIEFCWHFGRSGMRWLGAGMRLFDGDSQRDIGFRLGFWFGSLYLSLEDILPKRFGYPRHNWNHDWSFEIGVDGGSYGPTVTLNLHHAGDDCFDCKGRKGKHWYWWPLNTLLGKPEYNSRPLLERPERRRILMPEAAYPVDVMLTEDTWKRPRWPRAIVVRRANIECPGGIPTPGKGENSWDCGEDATFGLTCQAESVEEAIDRLKASVMEDRERYGGKDWLPEKARGLASA